MTAEEIARLKNEYFDKCDDGKLTEVLLVESTDETKEPVIADSVFVSIVNLGRGYGEDAFQMFKSPP